MTARTQDIGREAEARAEKLLMREGLHPVDRNFRCRGGEIDLIMRDGEYLVFVEVRYRRQSRFGGAASSVGANKQQRLILAARNYLLSNNWSGPCRFDVVAFDGAHDGDWIRDAFGT